MKICVLSSGSKGNTTYIESEKVKILIDIGNSAKYVKEKLEDIGVEPEEINAVLITCLLYTSILLLFPIGLLMHRVIE